MVTGITVYKRKPHKVFDNKLKQDFTAGKINRKWGTDFTYLFLADHDARYSCTIIDLYDRSVAVSITDRHITSEPAIRILQKGMLFKHGLDIKTRYLI